MDNRIPRRPARPFGNASAETDVGAIATAPLFARHGGEPGVAAGRLTWARRATVSSYSPRRFRAYPQAYP